MPSRCRRLGALGVVWKEQAKAQDLFRRAALPLALIVSCLAWLGYYDYRAFGNPLTLPYSINRSTYAIAPYFVWQPLRAEPAYRHESIRNFYHDVELKTFSDIRVRFGFINASCIKPPEALLFFGGFALIPPLFMIRRVFLDRRIRFLVLVSLCIWPVW